MSTRIAELIPAPDAHSRHSTGGVGFQLQDAGEGKTRLLTETRVRCGDTASQRAFKRYWGAVSVGSGLLRHVMLNQVRRAAED